MGGESVLWKSGMKFLHYDIILCRGISWGRGNGTKMSAACVTDMFCFSMRAEKKQKNLLLRKNVIHDRTATWDRMIRVRLCLGGSDGWESVRRGEVAKKENRCDIPASFFRIGWEEGVSSTSFCLSSLPLPHTIFSGVVILTSDTASLLVEGK